MFFKKKRKKMIMLSVIKCVILMISCVKAYDDFQDISIEDEFNTYFKTLDTIYRGDSGSILYGEDILILNCFGRYMLTRVIMPFKEIMTVSEIWIEECYLPKKPLVEVFRELNINTTAVENLRITVLHRDLLAEGNYTVGLNIKTLWIHTPFTATRNFLQLNPDFMQPLTNLTTLILWGTKLPELPPTMRLEVLSMRHSVIVPTWKESCRHLKKLSVHNLFLNDIPTEWPTNCSQLTSLRLKGLTLETTNRIISSGVNASCINLQSLYLQSCNLSSLPYEILNVAKDIKHLNLSNNNLLDNDLGNFPKMSNLTHLDLSKNQLTGWMLFDLVQQVPLLTYLNLDGNIFLNVFCKYEKRMNIFTTYTTSLERLSLNDMSMELNCFRHVHFSKLQYLGMASTDTDMLLVLYNLPLTNASRLVVDLRGRKIDEISFLRFDYENLAQGNQTAFWRSNYNYIGTNLTVLLTPIDCDCKHNWLALALRNFNNYISMPGLRCSNTGVEILKELTDNLNCDKSGRDGCTRRETPSLNNSTEPERFSSLECHNSEIYSRYVNMDSSRYIVLSLNLTSNNIETLQDITIRNSIKRIDLRSNRISRLNANDITKLFANPERQVWLSQNLFVCDCDNYIMLDAFHEHRNQIVDFEELICIDSGMKLGSVSTYEVCQYGLKTTLTVSGIFAALALIAALLLWRFRFHVKIYLYSRGWCLFCLSDDDLDADRPYDAFLSFSHGDEKYVVEELMPKLEGEPNMYRICVHYRDWDVGDWIPAQIMRSVRLSKRTIIVLSRSFVTSMWGSLEFRYAVASAAQEGRLRLLVLVLDDVLSEELDAELQGYLSYNTYLSRDDPWFWEKLRYAMPRRKQWTEKQSETNDKCDEILMKTVVVNSSNEYF